MSTIYATVAIEHLSCGECGIHFGLEGGFHDRVKRTGEHFYCPNGHHISYRDNETKRLRDQLAREKAQHDQTRAARDRANQRAEHEERRARTFKGHHTRIKARVAQGVCPCCNRTFGNLQRHMRTKHAAYVETSRGGVVS